jgi:hypothetical protein
VELISALENAVMWDVIRMALVRIDISEERIAPIIRVKRISELETTLTVTSTLRASVAGYC